MRSRTRRPLLLLRSIPWILACSFGLALAGPAAAQTRYEFFLDPAQSFLQIEPGSEIVLDLPAPLGSVSLPLVAQSDPATSGNVVPGIGLSDGTRTALQGAFVVDLSLPTEVGFTTSMVPVAAPPLITLVDSGQWLPGNASGPFAGDLAAEIGFSSLGLVVGEIVLRDLALVGFEGGEVSFVSADDYTFPAQPFSLDPEIGIQIANGSVVFRGLGFDGGVLLREGGLSIAVPADSGTLTRIGADDWRLAITFTSPLSVELLNPGPVRAEIDVTTTIVATTVPEPGPAGGLAAALGALAVIGWRRRGGRGERRRWSALWLVAFAILPACLQPQQVIPDANGDGSVDASEAAVGYSEGEGTGATASAASEQIELGIDETGQAPQGASCIGNCPGVSTPFDLSSGCGAVQVTAEPTGFRLDIASDCAASTDYSAILSGTQSAFNMSGVPKTFWVTLREWATSDQDLMVTCVLDGIPLTPNEPREVEISEAFGSLVLPIGCNVQYTASPGDAEVASVSIEVVTTETSCRSNVECGVGRACLSGTCADSGFNTFCLDSTDCVDPYVCIGSLSRCQEPLVYPGSCFSNFDCEGHCINAQCSEGMLDQPCNDDDDCDMSAPMCSMGSCSL